MATDFDDKAATWDDDPAKAQRATAAADAIRAAVPLTSTTRLLEYGAGTGLAAQALAADVGAMTLAEPSDGMRDVIHAKVAAGSLPADARIWDLDLAKGVVPDDEFDLIVTVMVLHHIHDVATVLDGFARLLAPGGHLCVVDLEAEDGSFHADSAGFDGHNGFDRDDLTSKLTAAGFAAPAFQTCGEVERENGTFPLFLATTRASV